MDIRTVILEENEKKCASFDRTKAKRVLILFRELNGFIGDLTRRLGRLRYIKEYFPNAVLDFNYSFSKHQWIYDGLLKDNPYIDKLFLAELDDCDFGVYDLVVYVDPDETSLLDTLAAHYEKSGGSGNYAPPVFSMTGTVFLGEGLANIKFPLYTGLLEYIRKTTGELHISDAERAWAEQWLRDRGVGQGDSVVVVLDTASGKEKILSTPVYFEFMQSLLRVKKIKVLNFDERGLGKEEFYRAWLGDLCDNMIFSKNLSLREAISLLSASSVRMIFGPCTGLMHCSSAIYNYYKKMGMDANDIPIMITYTGKYPGQESASEWWSNSPLIDCIMLKPTADGGSRLVKLSDLAPEDREKNDSLPCSRFKTTHLTDFVRASFQKRAVSPW